MALHHRREMSDMRFAYDHDRVRRPRTSSESDSEVSYRSRHSGSDRSYRTPTSDYSSSPTKRTALVHQNTSDSRQTHFTPPLFDDAPFQESPKTSVESYTSTVQSEEDLQEELPEYHVPQCTTQPYASSAIASTPSDFSELFPSRRKLTIRHDDSTLDGNMNLRIDTEVSIRGQRCDMTLFHLRMHDLKNREFSLRRYCRDSGREVCHSSRKPPKTSPNKRPGFQRSLSNALKSIRSKSDQRTPTLSHLKRNDSGYGSMHSVDFDDHDRPRSAGHISQPEEPAEPNSIKLEFSNYAHVDVKRTGVSGSKRYEFDYWGVSYAWRRVVRKDRGVKEVSFHLTKAGADNILAYCTPSPLNLEQAEQERHKGGWIPPCSMWIANEQLVRSQKDISDVVVASGLIALVDDSIRARFFSKKSKQLLIPVPKVQVGVEYIGPKRLINEMFNRRDTTFSHQSRPSSSSRPSTSGGIVTGLR